MRHAIGIVVAGLALACSLGEGDGDGQDGSHGTVRIAFDRADNLPDDPYLTTVRIEVTIAYEACLQEFYAAEPDWHADGPKGEPVFADAPGVCDGDEPELVPCEVEEISQELELASHLRVIVRVEGDLIENRVLAVGPIPTEELAGCEPIVGVASVRGLAEDGSTVWQMQSYSPTEAATDQGGEIVVNAGPP